MEIKVIQEPKYELHLSADEMVKLWYLAYDAASAGITNGSYFYCKLEDFRPAGGFKNR